MNNTSKFHFYFIFFSFSLFSQTAYAYIDPGTGSYIIQLAIAGFLGGIYAIKMYWKRILTFVKELKNKIYG